MNRMTVRILALTAALLPAAAFAGHSDLTVPASETFMLGGEQRAAMTVSGRNVGKTSVIVLSRSGGKDTMIATVAPGASFEHSFAIGETALLRNASAAAAAKLSVDFTGAPSDLSMRYAKPQ